MGTDYENTIFTDIQIKLPLLPCSYKGPQMLKLWSWYSEKYERGVNYATRVVGEIDIIQIHDLEVENVYSTE